MAARYGGIPVNQPAAPSGPRYGGLPVDSAENTERAEAESERSLIADSLGVGKDLLVSAAGGVNQVIGLAGDLYGLTTGDMDNWATHQRKIGTEFWGEKKSKALRDAEDRRAELINAADGELSKAGVALWETVSNPRLLSSFMSEQAPMFLPIGAAAQGAKAVARVAGAGEKAAGTIATVTGILTETLMNSADATNSAVEQLRAQPDELWNQHPEVIKAMRAGASLQEAKDDVLLDLARDAAGLASVVSLFSNLIPGSRVIEKTLAGAKHTGGRLSTLIGGVIGEGLQEGVQEGSTQLSANIATQDVNPAQVLSEGVGEATGMGLAAAPFGGVGALGPHADVPRIDEEILNAGSPEEALVIAKRKIMGMSAREVGEGVTSTATASEGTGVDALYEHARRQEYLDRVIDATSVRETTEHEFTSTQFTLPQDLADDVKAVAIAQIDPADVHPEEGLENTPHITVKYGIETDDAQAVRNAVQGMGEIPVQIGPVQIFDGNPEFDVVVQSVESTELRELNRRIRDQVPNQETFPRYQPHITLGYVKKGTGDKYRDLRTGLEGRTTSFDAMDFMARDETLSESIELGGQIREPITERVKVGEDAEIDTVLRVVESADLKVANVDRETAKAISRNLDPKELGSSSDADTGAPVVSPEGVIESGANRLAAIRQARLTNPAASQSYRDMIRDRGFTEVDQMESPVLVRERQGEPIVHVQPVEEAESIIEPSNEEAKINMAADSTPSVEPAAASVESDTGAEPQAGEVQRPVEGVTERLTEETNAPDTQLPVAGDRGPGPAEDAGVRAAVQRGAEREAGAAEGAGTAVETTGAVAAADTGLPADRASVGREGGDQQLPEGDQAAGAAQALAETETPGPGGAADVGAVQAEPERAEGVDEETAEASVEAGDVVDGLVVGEEISNQDSIEASLEEWEVDGLRVVQMSEFVSTAPKDLFYSADDRQRVRALAEGIRESGRIDPLIVVYDGDPEGPYVLEGAHRLGALHELGKTEFPALVVRDLEGSEAARETPYENVTDTYFERQRARAKPPAIPEPIALKLEEWADGGEVMESATLLDFMDSAENMAAGDRVVGVVPRNMMDKRRFEDWFYDNPATEGLILRARVDLPSFARSELGTPSQVLVIDRLEDTSRAREAASTEWTSLDLTASDSITDLFEALEGVRVFDRNPTAADITNPDPLFDAHDQLEARSGNEQYLAAPSQPLGERWKVLDQLARRKGATWSHHSNPRAGIRKGWVFPDAESRNAFVELMNAETNEFSPQYSLRSFFSTSPHKRINRIVSESGIEQGSAREWLELLAGIQGAEIADLEGASIATYLLAHERPITREEFSQYLADGGVQTEVAKEDGQTVVSMAIGDRDLGRFTTIPHTSPRGESLLTITPHDLPRDRFAELSAESMLRHAVEQGYDGVRFLPGTGMHGLVNPVVMRMDGRVRLTTSDGYQNLELSPDLRRRLMGERPAIFDVYNTREAGREYRRVPRETIDATVASVTRRINDSHGIQVRVVETVEELPQHVRDQLPQNREVRGAAFGNDVYLVRDGMASVAEVEITLAHELFGHLGVNAVVGDRAPQLLDAYRQMIRSGNVEARRIRGEVLHRYGPHLHEMRTGDDVTLSEMTELAEFIALAAEKRVREGPVGRFMRKVREFVSMWLRELGFTRPFGMTQIDQIISQGQRYLAGEALPDAVPAHVAKVQFSLDEQFTPEQQEVNERIFYSTDDSLMGRIRTRRERLSDRWAYSKGLRKAWARQKVIDQYESFRTVLDDDRSWMMSHLTAATSGGVEASIEYGQLFIEDDALGVDTTAKSLKEILEPLGLDVDRFLRWMAGNRGARLKTEGRENLMSDADIEKLKNYNDPDDEMAPSHRPDRREVFDQAREEFEAWNNNFLDLAIKQGTVNEEEAKVWRDQGFYVPFYRVLNEEEGARGPRVNLARDGLIKQTAFKYLKGGEAKLDDLLGNVLMNAQHLLTASMKNAAAVRALDKAVEMGLAKPIEASLASKDAIWVRKEGKQVWYEMNDNPEADIVLDSLLALNWEGLNGYTMRAMRMFKRALTIGVTASPEFKLANFIRDSIQAIAVADMSVVIPKNWWIGGQATSRKAGKSEDHAQMLAGGGIFGESGYIHGADPDAIRYLARKQVRRDTVLDTRWRIKQAFDKYQEWGARGENINRAANYMQDMAHGRDRLVANFNSRDHVDFSRTGSSTLVRGIAQVVPFLNARLQGLDKLARASASPAQKLQFASVVSTYALMSVGLYLAMRDDDDYKAAEEWERDTYHLFKLPGSEVIYRIPRPFEVGAIAAMSERLVEQFVDDDVQKELFFERLSHTILETFSFNPVPQLFMPMLEVGVNKNFFTGRKIESPFAREGTSPSYRMRAWTSETAIGLAQGFNKIVPEKLEVSPIQVEHLVRGYLGWIGSTALEVTDAAYRTANPNAPREPEMRWWEYPLAKRFFRAGVARNTKYMTEFYESMNDINRVYNDIRAVRERDPEAADRMKLEMAEQLEGRLAYNRKGRRLSKISKQMRQIRLDRTMSSAEKRRRLDELQQRKNAIAEESFKAELEKRRNGG